MADNSFFQRVKHFTLVVLKRILIVLIIGLLSLFLFLYFGTYESGVIAGKVLKISEKGFIFKTYEGKLSSESFEAQRGASPSAETFDFSVSNRDTLIIHKLEQVSLSGERVSLHYNKRYMKFPWRGDTKYFISEVEEQ